MQDYRNNGGITKLFDDNDYNKLKLTQAEAADEEFEKKMRVLKKRTLR